MTSDNSTTANVDCLSEIQGQTAAVTVLRNAFNSERIAGAYLFVGPPGVGKATTALRFAAMLCGAKSEADPICRRVLAGAHPDVRTVAPTGKSNTIHVGQLWPRGESRDFPSEQALLRDLYFEPMAGPRRVFIIDGAEGLRGGNEAAGNSILKSLEEPPRYAHFILTGESASGLLPTVTSRCQVVRFALSPASDIESTLVNRLGVDASRARFLSVYSEGRIGHAIVLARSQELLDARDDLLDLADRSLTAQPVAAFKLGEELRKIAPRLKPATDSGTTDEDKELGSRDAVMRALEMLAFYYRDLASIAAAGKDATIVNIDRVSRLVELARMRSAKEFITRVDTILGIRTAIERNGHVQLAVEVLFTQLLQ